MKAKSDAEMRKCLNPECKRYAQTRGLCTTCYGVARMLVHKKLTTWEQMEKSGRCTPAIRPGARKGTVTAWLLGGDK